MALKFIHNFEVFSGFLFIFDVKVVLILNLNLLAHYLAMPGDGLEGQYQLKPLFWPGPK